MTYLFDPNVLAEIVRMHVALPPSDQVRAVTETLRSVYGEHVSPGEPWMWSTAGGIMVAIKPVHVSLNEYLLFAGTAIGSEGHSGRHRADIYDVVLSGELWTYQPGAFDRKVYGPGDLALLARGTVNGSNLRPGAWLLEYARGNILSLFPFALGDTLFSTLDTTDLFAQIGVSTKLMLKEVRLWLEERKAPFTPNLEALKPEVKSARTRKGGSRRANTN